MQSGSPALFKLACVVLLTVGSAAFAQSADPTQILGSLSTQQPTACNPTDLGCGVQPSVETNTQQTSSQQQQRNQGIFLGQENTQYGNNNNNNNNNETTPQTTSRLNQREQVRLPLDSPTEFQQFVANSIGRSLPVYGASLFRNPPTTFAPLDLVPVTPDYLIGPGDELLIRAWGQITLNGRYLVDRSGNVYIPQVGAVRVTGMAFGQVQDYLKSQMSRVFRNFDLNVSMGQLRSIQVFVVGQARRPGTYTISSLSTLVNALFATGGPSLQGSLRHIQLRRAGKTVVEFDLYDLLLHGDKSNDAPLLPGDVIYIPPVGAQVAVSGSVNVPAIYELKSPGNTTVDDMLQMAGGLTSVAQGEKVRLERVDNRRTRSMIEVALDAQGKATTLQDGDLLEFVAVTGEYKDAVTLRGNVANPGRYAWRTGMRIRDLLPDKESLITRDYWLKRSKLGQPMLTYVPTCLPTSGYGIPSLRYGLPFGEEGDNPNWRYSSTRNMNLFGLPFGNQEGVSEKRSDTEDVDSSTTDGALDCGEIPSTATSATGNNDRYTPPSGASQTPQQATSTQSGTANASVGPSVANSSSGKFRPRNDVKLNEPDIDWSYAVIERQSKEDLTTFLLPFNLGKLVLQGDASQNLELLPGDVVTIFSKADIHVPQAEQTRFVRLEGEFKSSGIYSVRPGETLRQLIRRAGGLTPDAYLYGAEFTRESTRREQQQRLNQYVDQIALQVSTNATNNVGQAISAQDAAALAAAQQQGQSVVNSLRRAKATGRIVLQIPADSQDLDQLPDLPLEDGDKFIVPRIPSTVNVDGAVYDQNSFVFNPHKRLGDYLREAGGANRDADKSRAYVVRASGAVISKQYSSSLRGSGFESLHLYPGDTIIVPLNLDKGRTIRLIVNLAQIAGQLGIAIAAGNVVFR
ncbi:SLBB domain-containing protein [Edaphobacter bradus]|uniref:SLBB domain-containing protein n=1 Tax=Edaphobacter bradus TaxID=2259016 RepID=UPI0021E07357|nr:SLBB domain-containing protein [Edaphobacter bradus]